jgi:hypothetical protein
MKITVDRLRQIIKEELEQHLSEAGDEDPVAAVAAWLDDRKPTTDVSRKKVAADLAKKIASGPKGRADVDLALRDVRKDVHAKKDSAKQDKLNALSAALEDPETTAAFASTGKSKLPPLV